MLDPSTQPPAFRAAAAAARANELDPANLFHITWRRDTGGVHCELLPGELTGVEANILVLTGCHFPSGSHKVGAAYATLMEGELAGEIDPRESVIVGPSTGNFGIGAAYVSRLKGYPAVVIMPEQMSAERYQRIRQYGGRLDLTPGSESDVILVLERVRHYRQDPRNKILAQFETLPNYRFHRFVTGRSALLAARGHGNGRVAAFVGAPGSAGTLAAGDEIKAHWPEAVVCALEPAECPTLFQNGCGSHRIEGIGDKMVTLIHNVLTTDYVALVHDEDCLLGLELLECRQPDIERLLGLPAGSLRHLRGRCGVSGICNVLGAIRLARYLQLGPQDNVVTVATDGYDRYPSVLAGLAQRLGPCPAGRIAERFESIFRAAGGPVLDVRPKDQKDRLFGYKEAVWKAFDYSQAYLDRMKSQAFWDAEYDQIPRIDAALLRTRIG
jgi:cysteine synthase